ncbi:MAG: OsmC family protein [Desulfosarcinaceae bacterium]|nr:OsmC family protein [Desulfosarcinaceae bacterium]
MAATISVTYQQISSSASQGDIRGHRVTCDRPEAKGGGDAGPMGGELLLSGQAGCFMSNLLAAARARDLQLADAAVTVTGTVGEAPPRITAIELAVTAPGVARDQLEKLVTIAERGCLVANTLKNAVPLTITIA